MGPLTVCLKVLMYGMLVAGSLAGAGLNWDRDALVKAALWLLYGLFVFWVIAGLVLL